ncbi:hypothetical protein [Mycolicibacterium wolinskyi]|uniref:hypothetical protein n=1 Tax=Mycolicibacterium wolinskyi TaxID=59750 RepID=UPI00391791A0
MGRHRLAERRRSRRSAVVGAVVIPAATILIAGADTVPTFNPDVRCCAEVKPAAAVAPPVAKPAPAPLPPPDARAARRDIRVPLPVGKAPEKGLQVETILAARAVSAAFPEILTIGGVRSDPLKWHPHGLAIDVMIPHYATPEGKALGERIVAYVLDNADRFGVNHVIFRQTLYRHDGSKKRMSDRGGDTANHYDHVHIATNGGGYPTGHETYLR